MSGNSWVTLATNDSYSLGALVVAHSLCRVGTIHQLTVLVTPGVTPAMRSQLSSVFNTVVPVDLLDSKDEEKLKLMTRPELGVTFTKIHCWKLTQFSKCVFLDADVMILRNCDELFDREELSAAPDVGWPDCFNSGVFVYRPSLDTYNAIINFALTHGSFDGGDQGLLNMFFSDWATKDISRHLPFIYNMCSTATYSYLPAFKQFGTNVKIVHFIGAAKPWLQYFDTETRQVRPSPGSEHLKELLQMWWDIFCHDVHSTLSRDMAGLAGAFSQLTLGVARTAEQIALEDHLRKQAWEYGNIDYMGRDSFDNIWRKICETLSQAPQAPEIEPVQLNQVMALQSDGIATACSGESTTESTKGEMVAPDTSHPSNEQSFDAALETATPTESNTATETGTPGESTNPIESAPDASSTSTQHAHADSTASVGTATPLMSAVVVAGTVTNPSVSEEAVSSISLVQDSKSVAPAVLPETATSPATTVPSASLIETTPPATSAVPIEPIPLAAPAALVKHSPPAVPAATVQPSPPTGLTATVEPTQTAAPAAPVETTQPVAPAASIEPTPPATPAASIELTPPTPPVAPVESISPVAPAAPIEPTPPAPPAASVEPTQPTPSAASIEPTPAGLKPSIEPVSLAAPVAPVEPPPSTAPAVPVELPPPVVLPTASAMPLEPITSATVAAPIEHTSPTILAASTEATLPTSTTTSFKSAPSVVPALTAPPLILALPSPPVTPALPAPPVFPAITSPPPTPALPAPSSIPALSTTSEAPVESVSSVVSTIEAMADPIQKSTALTESGNVADTIASDISYLTASSIPLTAGPMEATSAQPPNYEFTPTNAVPESAEVAIKKPADSLCTEADVISMSTKHTERESSHPKASVQASIEKDLSADVTLYSTQFSYESLESMSGKQSDTLPKEIPTPTQTVEVKPEIQSSHLPETIENTGSSESAAVIDTSMFQTSPDRITIAALSQKDVSIISPNSCPAVKSDDTDSPGISSVSDQTAETAKVAVTSPTDTVQSSQNQPQKFIVTEPTPPTSPSDIAVSPAPAESNAENLKVESDIPPTPPISQTPGSSVSPSFSPATSSHPTDPKAPIPPKRRHRAAQNPEQAAKGGKPLKTPKGKK